MFSLIILIPITLLLAIIGLCCFFWNIKNNQYDDIKGAATRILFDDDKPKK